LLAKAVCQLVHVLDDRTPSRAGSLPQGNGCGRSVLGEAQILWELSLLAKAVGQLMHVLADTTPSRAGSLPQGNGFGHSLWACRKSCRS